MTYTTSPDQQMQGSVTNNRASDTYVKWPENLRWVLSLSLSPGEWSHRLCFEFNAASQKHVTRGTRGAEKQRWNGQSRQAACLQTTIKKIAQKQYNNALNEQLLNLFQKQIAVDCRPVTASCLIEYIGHFVCVQSF